MEYDDSKNSANTGKLRLWSFLAKMMNFVLLYLSDAFR